MKRIVFIVFIVFFCQFAAFADDETIWDYKHDEFIKDIIQGQTSITNIEKQKQLDKELAENLGIDLIYTDLAECLKVAVDNNYDIKIEKDIERQRYWEYRNANVQFLPDFSYNYNIKWISGTFLVGGIVPDTIHEVPIQSIFMVDWTTTKQGKLFFLNAQRRKNYKASISTKNFTKEQVILQTALTYYDLLSQKMELEVLKINIIDRQEQYKITQARYTIGIGDKFDVVRAEAELAKANQQYIAAFNTLRLLQAKLANIMGIEVLDAVYPSENSIEIRRLLDSKYDVECLYNMALVSRNDIRAAKLKIEALKAERSSNYMDFVPSLELYYANAMYGTQKSGLSPANAVGINIVAPLGENLALGSITKIKAYNAQLSSEENRLVDLERNVKQSIVSSYYDAKTALERIEAAKKEVLASDESLKIALVRMQVGESTFLDVIQAQSLKVASRQTLINTIIDYNKAQVQLLFDSGIITICGVLKNYQIPDGKIIYSD